MNDRDASLRSFLHPALADGLAMGRKYSARAHDAAGIRVAFVQK
jgi:hypothetical protein